MKLEYKSPMLTRLGRHKGILLVVGILVVFLLPKVVLEEVPRLKVRWSCWWSGGSCSLPLVELLLSDADFKALKPPSQGAGSAEVSVRLVDEIAGTDAIQRASMRRRGWVQPPPGRPFNFKLSFKDTTPAGFAESHFLFFGIVGVKQNRWAPLQMRLADELGLRTPRNRLVRVKINGQDMGVYWEFEHWGRNTFARFGIREGDIYGESDDQRFAVNLYLWKNLDSWKRYDVGEPQGSRGGEDYSELAALIDLVNNADEATFRRRIYGLIDFDAWVGWLVHTAAMNSYHQQGHINTRLLLNRDTMRFEPLPWDVVPGLLGRLTPRGTYTTHPLIVRLLNNDRFQRAFSRRLYEFYGYLEKESKEIFADLYLSPPLECSLVSSDNRDLDPTNRFPKSLNYEAFVSWAINPTWSVAAENMRKKLMGEVLRHKQSLKWSYLFVSRDVSGRSEGPFTRIARVGYRSQVASILESVDLPLQSTVHDGQVLDVELVLKVRPLPRIRTSPLFPEGSEPQVLRVQRRIAVSGGRISLEDLDLTLLPNYPRTSPLYGTGDHNRGWYPIESRDYDVFVRLSAPVPLATSRLSAVARSVATGELLEVQYKNFRNEELLPKLTGVGD